MPEKPEESGSSESKTPIEFVHHLHTSTSGAEVHLKARLVPGAVDGLRNALAWAGLDYDFGTYASSVLDALTPFAEGGKVVAKPTVGLGPPETVTVDALAAGEGTEPLPESAMEKRWEAA